MPALYSPSDRDAVLARAIELLEADPRVEAAVITGSLGAGRADRWSDFDLAAIIASDADCAGVAADWEAMAYREWPVVHHYATEFGSTLVRGFILRNGLLADLAFTPIGDFAAWAPVRVAFDRTGSATKIAEAWKAWAPTPDWRGESAFAAHDVLHACSAANRGRRWQALYFLQRIRTRTLSLSSERHGLDSDDLAHADELPPAESNPCSGRSSPTWRRQRCWGPSTSQRGHSSMSCGEATLSLRAGSRSRCERTCQRPGNLTSAREASRSIQSGRQRSICGSPWIPSVCDSSPQW